MAAIDKMYVKHYYEYDDLLRWSLIYYPKLLSYFYDIHITQGQFDNRCKNYVKQVKKINQAEINRKLDGSVDISLVDAAMKIKLYYKNTANYDASDIQCYDEAKSIIETSKLSDDQIEAMFSCAVLNTPFKVDKYLKWHCPLPCIRDYLHKQCGVNPKWEWLYRLFWKGKKEYA